MEKGDVFVISAPSGSGKTTICRMLAQRVENIQLSVSYTTRPRKEGEVDGKDYYFVKPEIFDKMIVSREFLESASVYGNRYGTSPGGGGRGAASPLVRLPRGERRPRGGGDQGGMDRAGGPPPAGQGARSDVENSEPDPGRGATAGVTGRDLFRRGESEY